MCRTTGGKLIELGSAGSQPAPNDKPLPWRAWACGLSLAYGWTPNQIAEMTGAQVAMYATGETTSTGRRTMPLDEAREWIARRRRHKENWIRRMMEKHGHGK